MEQAQRHLESQCRRKLKKNDMRLNILITALPGVDADVFCRQMFAEVSGVLCYCFLLPPVAPISPLAATVARVCGIA